MHKHNRQQSRVHVLKHIERMRERKKETGGRQEALLHAHLHTHTHHDTIKTIKIHERERKRHAHIHTQTHFLFLSDTHKQFFTSSL